MSFIFLNLLIMHYCTFVIIGPVGNIETQVAETLAPFDESLEVGPYEVYLEEAEIKRMAGHYGLDVNNFPALVEKMPDWRGTEGGVDEIGLFSEATANPDGKWDWYEIGGRWNRFFHGRNVIKTRTLLKALNMKEPLPHNVVTPNGWWHEVETLKEMHSLEFKMVRKSKWLWLREVNEVLKEYPTHRVVCVDIHG